MANSQNAQDRKDYVDGKTSKCSNCNGHVIYEPSPKYNPQTGNVDANFRPYRCTKCGKGFEKDGLISRKATFENGLGNTYTIWTDGNKIRLYNQHGFNHSLSDIAFNIDTNGTVEANKTVRDTVLNAYNRSNSTDEFASIISSALNIRFQSE